jgi:hypothetical protein
MLFDANPPLPKSQPKLSSLNHAKLEMRQACGGGDEIFKKSRRF